MSRHLPAISGRELVKALRRSGFVVLRQKGSHVALERRTVAGYWRTIVRKNDTDQPREFGYVLRAVEPARRELSAAK